MAVNKNKKSNDLIHETSPYLLQHASNPVDWKPWNENTLAKAKEEDKPILVSIGYSACHWCHVMEHESFENDEVAEVMNAHFVCIKVDREERPDVDQLYMNAAQLITGKGGWPLNCFTMPDGRPFHAGTYFPKENWMQVLKQVQAEFQNNRAKLNDYANRLVSGIEQTGAIVSDPKFNTQAENVLKQVDLSVIQWSQRFDNTHGGSTGAPKFPIPNNYSFLSRYAFHFENHPIDRFVDLSLTKMARGGIYDQIEGGFARYSVDALWKLPHFEKMLYDNGQLLEVYSERYKKTKNPQYLQVVHQTADFIKNELMTNDAAFYSAYDADSDGVEGKYYVWTKKELQDILGDDFALCEDYYSVNDSGYWEDGNYILLRGEPDAVMLKHSLTSMELESRVKQINEKLLKVRAKRIKPGLDDKSLTNWNGLMISGYVEAYKATGNEEYLSLAVASARFIVDHQLNDDNSLWHSYKNGLSTIHGFLEDYACVIKAFLDVYSATMEVIWAKLANQLCRFTLDHFYNAESGFFHFTSHDSSDLVVKNVDYFDNVIPSSNSMMCRNLIQLGRLYLNAGYQSIASEMLTKIAPKVSSYGSGFSNWMLAILDQYQVYNEVVVVGENAKSVVEELQALYLPNCLISGSEEGRGLPIFESRWIEGKTLIYVCHHNTCQAPIESVEEALRLLKK